MIFFRVGISTLYNKSILKHLKKVFLPNFVYLLTFRTNRPFLFSHMNSLMNSYDS